MVDQRKINKILFITLTNIGDVVLTLPSLDYLKDKFKQATFTVLSGPNASILFSQDPRITENISYNKHAPLRKKVALFNRLRKEKFDVVIDLRDTVFRWLVRTLFKNPRIISIPKNITHLRLRHLYKTLAAFKEEDKVNSMKIQPSSICLDEKIYDAIEEILKKRKLSMQADYIVVVPGARSHTKRWLRQGFIKICHNLLNHYSVILVGDQNDSSITEDINKHLEYRCIDLANQTSLLEATAILKNAKLVICNDSSILQISSYLNIPTLAVFGPTDENKYGPLSDVCAVARKNSICTPCEGDDCKSDWQCMVDIMPQSVIDTAHSLIDGKIPKSLSSFRRILITRTDRLGDVLLSTPVIKNLRDNFPGAYIAMMVQESLIDLLRGNPYLDEVIALDKRGKHKGLINMVRLARELKRKNFDLALILHPALRMHLVLFFSGIKKRIGYDRKWGCLNSHILKHTKQFGQKHESEYALEFLKELGVTNFDKSLFMPVYNDSDRWVDNLFAERKINSGKIVTVHSQASCPSKVWPKDYFYSLVDNIANNYKTSIIYIGEKSDQEIKDSDGRINLTGKTSISQLASILKRSSVFISNDSGPVHMAVALGVPVISIFGRKQPGLGPNRWGPLGEKSVFIQKDVGCQVCLAHDCKRGFECLKAIKPQEVFDYVEKFLAK